MEQRQRCCVCVHVSVCWLKGLTWVERGWCQWDEVCCCMVLLPSTAKINVQNTHADVMSKRKLAPLQTRSFIPSKGLLSSTRGLCLNASSRTSLPLSGSFPGHPLADAVSSSPFFHSTPCAFMDHCMFAVRVEEKGRVAEGGLVKAHLPSSATRAIFSRPPCDPHTLLWPFALVRSSTSCLASNLPCFFLKLFLSHFLFKKIRLRSELTMGIWEALKYFVIFQRNHSYICVCVCTRVQWNACISTEEKVAKTVDQTNSLNIYWGCLVSFCLVISFNLAVLVVSLI